MVIFVRVASEGMVAKCLQWMSVVRGSGVSVTGVRDRQWREGAAAI